LAPATPEATAREIINYCGKRSTLEPGFRDIKRLRFGMGLTILDTSQRRGN
jgi:hypothetical protein